jgi:hypothetical protein
MIQIQTRWNAAFLLGCLLLATPTWPSDTARVKLLNDYVQIYHEEGEFNGCILVAERGETLNADRDTTIILPVPFWKDL